MNTICLETRKILKNQNDFWPVFTGKLDKIERRELSWQTKQFRSQVTAGMVKEFLQETRPAMVRRKNPVIGDPVQVASEFLMWHLDDFFVQIKLENTKGQEV
jgi:hypothetical protein